MWCGLGKLIRGSYLVGVQFFKERICVGLGGVRESLVVFVM